MGKSNVLPLLEEYPTNEGDVAVIVHYESYDRVTVTFTDSNTPHGFTLVCQLGDLRRGRVKNPYKRQIYGVGYKGVGNHMTTTKGKNTKCYKAWSGMLERCYSERLHKTHPTYKGCLVHDDWHNFQTFAEWYVGNYIEGWELDKDLLIKGNKVYGHETCCFLPSRVNSCIVTNKCYRKDLPIGVRIRYGRYNANVSTGDGSVKNLGMFDTSEEAFFAYKTAKEGIFKRLAKSYKEELSHTAYAALINRTVSQTD